MNELFLTIRRIFHHLFQIVAVFAVGYVLVLFLLVLVEIETKLSIVERVALYLRVFPGGGK